MKLISTGDTKSHTYNLTLKFGIDLCVLINILSLETSYYTSIWFDHKAELLAIHNTRHPSYEIVSHPQDHQIGL